MTRHLHKARVHTKDFPFAGAIPSLFELPPRVRRGALMYATAYDEHPVEYHRHLHVATTEAGSVLDVTFEPPKHAIATYERSLGRHDLADYLGYVRYVCAPRDLVSFAYALPLGKDTTYKKPFAPDGPFEFVPPAHGYDYTTRARLQLPTRIDNVQDAADLLLDVLTQSRVRRTEPLVLHFMYKTPARGERRAQ
jgi:hypothetical protein